MLGPGWHAFAEVPHRNREHAQQKQENQREVRSRGEGAGEHVQRKRGLAKSAGLPRGHTDRITHACALGCPVAPDSGLEAKEGQVDGGGEGGGGGKDGKSGRMRRPLFLEGHL